MSEKTHEFPTDKFAAAYEHWYMRRDEEGVEQRPPDAIPGKLFPKILDALKEQYTLSRDASAQSGKELVVGEGGAFENLPLPGELNPPPADLTMPDEVEAIVAMIDTDIPLGHRAFRLPSDGESRVLFHWNMGQKQQSDDTQLVGQDYVTSQINALLQEHSGGDLQGDLDQDAFNRAIGSTDFDRLIGTRGLQTRYSHGAHMLDVAAGANAEMPTGEMFGKKVGIVSVSMPSRWEFGEGGEFLDMFMLYAIVRVYRIVAALRAQRKANKKNDGPLPCVVSLAFGRQAGAKRDNIDVLGQVLEALDRSLGDADAPFDLVMPIGNDNLDRVVARYSLKKDEMMAFDWMIPPSDQSDNYLEVWAEAAPAIRSNPVQLAVALVPANETMEVAPQLVPRGKYFDVPVDKAFLGARVYGITPLTLSDAPSDSYAGYLFATSSSDPRVSGLRSVPAGRWKVVIQNKSDETLQVNCSVQTDQSALPLAGVSGRSYLDDCTYQMRDEEGRLIDSVAFKDGQWGVTDNATGVRRSGTINAASSQQRSGVVGGYRRSDGQPALYSATGAKAPLGLGRSEPNGLLPTDDTPVLGGMLAGGASDGSKVAMRGTSFAASKATRLVVETWLSQSGKGEFSRASAILDQAAAQGEDPDAKNFKHPYDTNTKNGPNHKFGKGRAIGGSYLIRTEEGRAYMPSLKETLTAQTE